VSHARRIATVPSARPLTGVFQDEPLACVPHCIAAAQLHGRKLV